MRIAVDASGDPGVDPQGSSPFYVSVAVVVSSTTDADDLTRAIDDFARRARHKHEFRFSKCNEDMAHRFFAAIGSVRWQAFAVVYDKKASNWSLGLKTPAQFELASIIATIQLVPACAHAHVLVDGHGDDRVLYTELRHVLEAGAVKTARYSDSKKSRLVQVADMVAGALSRHRTRKTAKLLHPAVQSHLMVCKEAALS
jgi:hypothetical protein